MTDDSDSLLLCFAGCENLARSYPAYALKLALPAKWLVPVAQGGKTATRLTTYFAKSYNTRHVITSGGLSPLVAAKLALSATIAQPPFHPDTPLAEARCEAGVGAVGLVRRCSGIE